MMKITTIPTDYISLWGIYLILLLKNPMLIPFVGCDILIGVNRGSSTVCKISADELSNLVNLALSLLFFHYCK